LASSNQYVLAEDLADTSSYSELDQLLAETFRIDIKEITVTFDYYPDDSYASGIATIIFQMRPGQTIPLIHFDPALRYDSILEIKLNGESLNFYDTSDIQVVEFDGSAQKAIEFQRTLPQNREHTLEINYRLFLPEEYPRFSTIVNDLEGRGNEERFPTLNSPEELCRHVLDFRVHGQKPYIFLGSGLVKKMNNYQIQHWQMDTEQEVASYAVMFVLVPEEDFFYEEREIQGIPVRIAAFKEGASIADAFSQLESWLPELEADLGPFPMTRGLSVLLSSIYGGMEYFGATISSPEALKHEVFHMYFGCSTVGKTYRDTWMDEAINEWYEHSEDPDFYSMSSSYVSNWVGGRSPISVGFDSRAYDEGSHIMQAVAERLGGRQEMVEFLSYLHLNYSFAPFTTFGFLDYLKSYSGIDMKNEFINWLYNGNADYPDYTDSYHKLIKKDLRK
jgi:aminopeptidase N